MAAEALAVVCLLLEDMEALAVVCLLAEAMAVAWGLVALAVDSVASMQWVVAATIAAVIATAATIAGMIVAATTTAATTGGNAAVTAAVTAAGTAATAVVTAAVVATVTAVVTAAVVATAIDGVTVIDPAPLAAGRLVGHGGGVRYGWATVCDGDQLLGGSLCLECLVRNKCSACYWHGHRLDNSTDSRVVSTCCCSDRIRLCTGQLLPEPSQRHHHWKLCLPYAF